MKNEDYILEIKDLTVCYSGHCALQSVNLDVRKDEFLGIIGPNGGGKSTLLKAICGLIKPSSGTIKLNSSRSIGYVPQFSSFSRDFPISVIEVVLTGMLGGRARAFHRYSSSDIYKAKKTLSLLGILELEKRQIGTLSGGQLQKVLIARALVSNPEILLLDEPTASIDSTSKSNIYEFLSGLSKDMAVIIVSHDIGTISSYVHSIACLNKKLYYHGEDEVDLSASIEKTYGCPIDMIAHGFPHRVLSPHLNHKALREEDNNV